jgi:hypothetical protein
MSRVGIIKRRMTDVSPRCRRCREGVAHEFKHGCSSYRFHRCRCGICVEAHNAYIRVYYRLNHDRLAQMRRRSRQKKGTIR